MYGFFIVAVPCLPCLRYRDGTAGGGRGATLEHPACPPVLRQPERGRERAHVIDSFDGLLKTSRYNRRGAG